MLDRLRISGGLGRVPMLLQTEAAECGLACLAMVATANGHVTDLATMRQRFSLSLKGATMADLVRMAGELQFNPRAVRAELEHLPHLKTPCVLHWDLNHFVVLVGVRRGLAVIHDPARGVRRLPLAEVSKHFTGVALEIAPAPGFRPHSEKRSVSLRQLLGHITGLKRSLGQILLLGLALEAFVLLMPFLTQWVVDGVIVSADRDLLVTLGVGFGLLALLTAATSAVRSWAVLYLSATLNLQWLGNVFAHLMRLPVAWFEKRHTGDILSRFGAIKEIQKTLTTQFIEVVLDGLLVLVTLAMMFVYSVQLAAIGVGAVLLYALMRWAFFRPQREATEEAIVHEARQSSHFLESLRGVQAIQLFNRQADRQGRFMNLVVDTMNADLSTRRLDIAFKTSKLLLTGLERVAVIWLGARLVLDQQLSVGMLFAFIAYKEQFIERFSSLIDKGVELSMLRLHGERLADIVLTAPEAEPVPATHRALKLDPQAPQIELRGVGFRYSDSEPDVLRGCSLSIAPGESVAIVGPSGSGKTTLLKLMLGIHGAQSGSIHVSGVPLQQLGVRNWRSMIGTVMQDDQLFAGSIADNISFFDPQASDDWIEECARRAAVHDEIEALPMGYQTLIGDMGASLSGGQRQRILLARALYKRPKVLFLDEATSALDVDRERLVNQAIRQLELTRVIVAHRPETIASAARVIVLSDGRVAQDLRTVVSQPTVPGQGGH